jgi:transcription elongation factor Elf1
MSKPGPHASWIATVEVSRGTLSMRRMTIQLSCPLCQDEVICEVDESADELVCGDCGARVAFAPDPVITYGLLYEPAA